MARIKIGDLLVKAGLIDEMQLQAGLAHQRQWGGKLGDALVANGFVDEMMLWKGLSKQLGVPLVSLPEHAFPPGIDKVIPVDLCRKHAIVPMARDVREAVIATSEPNNIAGIDEVAFRVGARLRVVLAPDREIEWAVRRLYNGEVAPCPPPRLRRVLAEVDPGVAMASTHARGQVVDFAARGATTPASELPQASRSGSIPASPFATQPGFAVAPPAAMPAGGVSSSATFSAVSPTPVMNPFASGAAQPMTQAPFAPPQAVTTSMLPQASPSSSGIFPAGLVAAATSASAAQTEAAWRETTALQRYVVEACIARGVFTREEYVARVRAQP